MLETTCCFSDYYDVATNFNRTNFYSINHMSFFIYLLYLFVFWFLCRYVFSPLSFLAAVPYYVFLNNLFSELYYISPGLGLGSGLSNTLFTT